MAIYLRKFETTEEYEMAKSTFRLPNVSLCKDTNINHYNPRLPFFCILTLSNGNFIEIKGDGELTSAMTVAYKELIVDAEIGTLCTSIGDETFSGCSSLTSCTIGSSVTNIGRRAFLNCTSLTNIVIPDNVNKLNISAFYGCSSLENVEIGSGITFVGSSCFGQTPWWSAYSADTSHYYGNIIYIGDIAYMAVSTGITSCTFKESTSCIAGSAFENCKKITGSLVIPDSAKSLGERAFYKCSGITSVNIGDGVEYFGHSVFMDCNKVTSIHIGKSLKEISVNDISSFNPYNRSLTTITVDANNTVYDSRNNCNAIIETSTNTLIFGCKNTIIPNDITSIGDDAFFTCYDLTSVTIPNSVTSIGDSAFNGCGRLTNVTIGSGVTSIGNYAFDACGFTSIVIPSSVTSIGIGVFYYCDKLTSIEIPDGVTSIGNSAFRGCTGLTSCTIGSGVTSIDQNAFYQCSGLTSIIIPNGVTGIGEYAFYGCSGLTSCTIGSGVTSIGKGAFDGCSGLTSIDIPSGVTSIGNWAFQNCRNLTNIVSNATTAPTIQSSTFRDVKTGGTLTVPQGSSGYNTWMQNANYYLGLYNWTKVEQ